MLPKNIKNVEKTCVLIDYANLLSSVKYLNKKIDLKIFYDYLTSLSYIKKISFYYGTDPRNPKSYKFIHWLRKTGYEVVTKDVKYIKLNLEDALNDTFKGNILNQIEESVVDDLRKQVKTLRRNGVKLELPKCNLDIEIALDIQNSMDTYDSFILVSGDGDFERIIKSAKSHGKHITVIALRKFLAGELIKQADRYVNLKAFKQLKGFLYSDNNQ